LTLQDKPPALSKDARLHVGLTLRTLLDDERGRAALEEHLGAVLAQPGVSMVQDLPLQQIAQFVPEVLPPRKLERINKALASAGFP
jgi:hypothetical protein